MSYWRKLLIVVLLALSLPVQSFAAVSMQCGLSHAVGDDVSVRHGHTGAMARHHHTAATLADQDQSGDVSGAYLQHHHPASGEHHAHACSACGSCCTGGALPLALKISPAAVAANTTLLLPPAARIASFLTGGIERPPRLSLV